MNPKADWFFTKETTWQKAYAALRTIALDCGLTEELKWGCPCYTLNKSNIVLIHGFKDYCALLFMKGALLKDAKGILIQQTENVQTARQLRFTSVTQIIKLQKTIKQYIFEAVEIERSGLKFELKKTAAFKMPDEFRKSLNDMPALKTAFEALTPGRQRGYLLYFSAAKQAKTRQGRIEKYLQPILNGKGLED
jgi:uncharacterized protein YdeI (YjbR/CyaY-like superfamily)